MVKILNRKNRFLFLIEAFIALAVVVVSLRIRFHEQPIAALWTDIQLRYKWMLFTTILWMAFYLTSVYRIDVLVDRRSLFPQVARGLVLSGALYATVGAIVPDWSQSRLVFAAAVVVTYSALLIMHAVLRLFYENSSFLSRVLVLGNGPLAKEIRNQLRSGDFQQQLIEDPAIEQRIVTRIVTSGCATMNEAHRWTESLEEIEQWVDRIVVAFDDQGENSSSVGHAAAREIQPSLTYTLTVPSPPDEPVNLLPHLRGRLIPFDSAQRSRLRQEFVSTPSSFDQLRSMVKLKLSDVPVIGGLDYYEQLTGRVFLEKPRGPFFFLEERFSIDPINLAVKNVWERVLALAIFLITLPAQMLVPLLIYLDTGRPLLFIQRRIGRAGKEFNLLKWRSMTDDGRITRVGHLIRATKLDELPQLINVLRGDMALVGPRPEMPEFTSKFQKHDVYYELRHMVRPGVTGWAQILFPHARAEDAMTKLAYDLYYVKHFSLISDIVIMLETFKMLAFGSLFRRFHKSRPVSNDDVPVEQSESLPLVGNSGPAAISAPRDSTTQPANDIDQPHTS